MAKKTEKKTAEELLETLIGLQIQTLQKLDGLVSAPQTDLPPPKKKGRPKKVAAEVEIVDEIEDFEPEPVVAGKFARSGKTKFVDTGDHKEDSEIDKLLGSKMTVSDRRPKAKKVKVRCHFCGRDEVMSESLANMKKGHYHRCDKCAGGR